MGEAKRRTKEIAQLKQQEEVWRASLTKEEREILDLAERLEVRLVRGRRFSEGCYHIAFFMTQYLFLKGIEVTPIIGWINDGTWQGMTSHGWIEYNGRKTDASLTCTSHPEAQPTGALIVHDYVLRKGNASYSYYKNDAPAALEGLAWMRSVHDFRSVLAHKEREHKTMLEIALSNRRIEEYLANAPPGGRFDEISRLIG